LNIDLIKKYKEKVVVVPHGDYFGNYLDNKIDIRKRYKIADNKRILLFVGMVRKYKNIEVLVNAFNKSKINKDFVLLICGSCNDEEYKDSLRKMASKNVIFDFSFVNNDEMYSYLEVSDLMVAPYDKTSSLNSGTLWMAMSYKKTMILPAIGCTKDFDASKYLYIYDYSSNNSHVKELQKTFDKVYDEYIEDKEVFKKKGEAGYKFMKNERSWLKNKEKWLALFDFE
jgi:glycosyltransferase involved in cell wall biosynthesis